MPSPFGNATSVSLSGTVEKPIVVCGIFKMLSLGSALAQDNRTLEVEARFPDIDPKRSSASHIRAYMPQYDAHVLRASWLRGEPR